tara:strand:+ start:220 stop:369 length:150 start_codon:yes stop_codon:yes gene_type:complete
VIDPVLFDGMTIILLIRDYDCCCGEYEGGVYADDPNKPFRQYVLVAGVV